jgi:hypothetical protein
MVGSLSMVSSVVSSAKVTMVNSGEVRGLQWIVSIILALGHRLWICPHWLERVLCTQFQPSQGSVFYANRILRQGNNSKAMTALTCMRIQYAIRCRMFERCLKILQNSNVCFQEII